MAEDIIGVADITIIMAVDIIETVMVKTGGGIKG
jgi:hypothetical protein